MDAYEQFTNLIKEYDWELKKQYYKEFSEELLDRYTHLQGIGYDDSAILNNILNSLTEKYIIGEE